MRYAVYMQRQGAHDVFLATLDDLISLSIPVGIDSEIRELGVESIIIRRIEDETSAQLATRYPRDEVGFNAEPTG